MTALGSFETSVTTPTDESSRQESLIFLQNSTLHNIKQPL